MFFIYIWIFLKFNIFACIAIIFACSYMIARRAKLLAKRAKMLAKFLFKNDFISPKLSFILSLDSKNIKSLSLTTISKKNA